MSRPRRTHSSSLQLFPFLAVLVSALGALVLLLLAVNRQVSLQAVAAAAHSLIEQTTAEENALTGRRRELEQDLRSLRTQMDKVHGDQRVVEQTLESGDRQLQTEAIHSERIHRDLDRLRESRDGIEQRIAAIRREIAAIQAAKDQWADTRHDPDRTFVPVVHPGSKGTARQPIYLECTARGVTIQPEGVTIPAWFFEQEHGSVTLVRAVQSLAQYYLERDIGKDSAGAYREWEPYPLLLVRPDGALLFYAARRALEDMKVPFGYELLEPDWTLQFPEADPRALAALAASFDMVDSGATAGRSNAGLVNPSFGRRDRGDGRVALTPNLGRLLGLEPAPKLNPGRGGGDVPDQNGRGIEPHTESVDSTAPAGWLRRPQSDAEQAPAGELPTKSPSTPRMADATNDSLDNSAASEPIVSPDSNQSPAIQKGRPSPRQVRSTIPDGSGRERVPQSSLAHEQYSQGNGATPPSPLADDENDQIPAMATLALPATSGKIPVSRKIEIECRADGLMIPGRTVYLSIPNAASFRGAVSTLVGEVEREVARWGPPGLTFRWQPKLLCIVRADGLEMYYGLRAALVGSSIDIEHLILAEDEMDWSDSLFLRHLERAKFDTQRFME